MRFKSKGRGLDSVENKWEKSGLRFLLQPPEEGNQGWLVWGKDRLPAIIDWNDPVVKYRLDHRIKYARLVRRKASSPQARGADCQGYRYSMQLALAGTPYQKKPKNQPGHDVIGLDLGPATLAIVPREGEARLVPLCEELRPNARKKRRLERKLDRKLRANNPQNYDEKGRIKKHGKRRFTTHAKKSLAQRWHQCACGFGPLQRDLYSAFLAAYLEPPDYLPSSAQYHRYWEGADLRLRAALERLHQRAREGQVLPRSVGISGARARLPQSLVSNQQELLYRHGRLEALEMKQEPPVL